MTLKRTQLYDIHRSLGARLVPFAGWEMPVQYTGVIEEHLAVRSACGIFDVSHMGQIEVSGAAAWDFVQNVATNDIDRIEDGQCQYALLCNPQGGVVDDTIIYRYNDERFMFCVNASNVEKVYKWFKANNSFNAVIEDVSAEYALIALQGPNAAAVIEPIIDITPAEIRPFHFAMVEAGSAEAMVSRTGYTGEDGFEIYVHPDDAPNVWNALMASGAQFGITPVGLGARDTLRLEMGYSLYGHELDDATTPLEAGLDKYVRLDKAGFIGKDALKAQSEKGISKSLVAIKMIDAGIPRAGYELVKGGVKAGSITSGTMSPSLNVGIGLGYVDAAALKDSRKELEVMIRARAAKVELTKLPFYRKNALPHKTKAKG